MARETWFDFQVGQIANDQKATFTEHANADLWKGKKSVMQFEKVRKVKQQRVKHISIWKTVKFGDRN